MKKDVGIPNLNGVNHVVAYGRKSIAIVEIIACSIFLSLFIYQGRLFSPDTKISVGYILISGFCIFFIYVGMLSIMSLLQRLPVLVTNQKGIFKRKQSWNKNQWNFFAWEQMSSAYYSNESKDEYSSFQLVFTSRDNKIIKVKLISLNFSESEVLETVKKYSIIHKFGFLQEV